MNTIEVKKLLIEVTCLPEKAQQIMDSLTTMLREAKASEKILYATYEITSKIEPEKGAF